MAPRLELQTLLESLVPDGWKVYFQPPNGFQMQYPCIVYKRGFAKTLFADNAPYRYMKRYQVTVMDRDPDSPVPDVIAELPHCLFDRFFVAEGLNHDVYNLYF